MSIRRFVSSEIKILAVKHCLIGTESLIQSAARFGVSRSTLQKWLLNYEMFGAEGLCHRAGNHHYTEAELLEGYFFSVSGLYEDNSSPFLAPRPALPGELSSVYNEVKPMVKQVADGTRASTILRFQALGQKRSLSGALPEKSSVQAN